MPRIGSTSDSPPDLLTRVPESGISLKEPQALENHGRSPLFERREAGGSRVSELSADSTPSGPWDDCGLQRGPACLSRCAQPIHSHSEGSRIGSDGGAGAHEMTPAGALKMPLPRWKSAPGGPEDGTPGGWILGGRPRPRLPRGPLLNPGCSRWQGGSRRAPGAQRSPSFKGDAA